MKSIPNRILVALDLEGRAQAAAHFALRLSQAFGASLEAVHVASALKRPVLYPFALEAHDAKEHHLKARMQLKPAWPTTAILHEAIGNPAEAIATLATDRKIQLLMLGGPSEGLRHLILGGTARDILHVSPCPVMIVKHEVQESAEQHIVVACDSSELGRNSLTCAIAWARALGATLETLYVFEPPSFAYDPVSCAGASAVDQLREQEYSAFERFLTSVDFSGVLHKSTRVEGVPGEVINRVAGQRPSLITMGTHGRTGQSRLLMGSVAESVLKGATSPVLLVPASANA
jgi:nucleotide-binding universal stress UspA family protein